MLQRELVPRYMHHHYINEVTSKFNSNLILCHNTITHQLLTEAPAQLKLPSGGLLTDEMGLGKTVEMIGLLLMNPRRLKRKFEEVDRENVKQLHGISGAPVKCICHEKEKRKSKKKKTIECPLCNTSQHIACMFQGRNDLSEDDRNDYLCPICWKLSGKVIQAKTTIIVTPASIKNQWKEEVHKHVRHDIEGKTFTVLMYDGISSGWISPPELGKYDIVITDFNTLSRELYFSDRNANERSLRHERKFEYPPSPLTSVEWWRVVLDEAQMVENKNNRPSQMVKQLPSVHRWATTGTPIEKGSFGCLYGLLFFINFEPFTEESIFMHLLNGPTSKMVEVLSSVMWRTCKKNVEDEIQIPKQTEVVHRVEMTSLQRVYYKEVHSITKPNFLHNIESYLRRQGPWVRDVRNNRTILVPSSTYDIALKDRFLCDLDNATMRAFIEPLRRLRQDCTIPTIFHQSNDNSRIKQILRPEQLHDHLVTKTSLETKSALRTICSSLNGMAALKIAEENFDEAVKLYNQVLKLASDYGSGFVAVDSMLQIHSYNNLLEISEMMNIEEVLKKKDEYKSEMGRLEWKYISKYYDVVQKVKEEILEHRAEMRKTKKEYSDSKGMWWRDIIRIRRSAEEESRLMDLINTELFTLLLGQSQIANELRSTHGIELVVTEWSDKVKSYTTDVNESFKKLNFIVENLQPTNLMSEDDQEKLNRLAAAALDCHLNLFEENSDDESTSNRQRNKKKGSCDLCKLKMKLNEYECLLFNKSLVDDVVEGTWNPRMEEKLLKAILTYAKRSDFESEFTDVGQCFFNRLEALKTQFKLLSKLWVEVNYTISAYDEINMCKMRMQVVDSPTELTEEDVKYRLKITRPEIPHQIRVFAEQKLEAEVSFARLNGRLKYLQHLKEKNEPQPCVICTNIPKERYFVTVCGHFICAECFPALANRSRSIKCPVCRTLQEVQNIYAVTYSDQDSSVPLNGTYSPKIDAMTRCILALKQKEPDVKILIFSYWDSILQAIAAALQANHVEFRSSYNGQFVKQIAEFKDYRLAITCMMLNLKFAGKGLNLTEATHVFLVEPILNADEELQAIGRVHRIGQTRETVVHRFITRDTIEEKLHDKITREKEKWSLKAFTIRDLEELVDIDFDNQEQGLVQLF